MSIHDVLVGWAIGVGSGVFVTVTTNYIYHKIKGWQISGGNGRHSKG